MSDRQKSIERTAKDLALLWHSKDCFEKDHDKESCDIDISDTVGLLLTYARVTGILD